MFRQARALRLVPFALSLAAAPALSQGFDALGFGVELDPASRTELLDRAARSGHGVGTWIEAGTQPGAAFAELFDQDGVPRFLLEAQAFALTSGPGEYWAHGTVEGELLPYELYIVPTDVDPVGIVLGEWFMTGANRGVLDAVVLGLDGALAGAVRGTFELPPILVDPDLPPPGEHVGAKGSAAVSAVRLNQDLPFIGPMPVGDAPDGGVGVGAVALGPGTQVNPHMQYIPPYPYEPGLELDAQRLGGGREAEGLGALSQARPSVGSSPGVAQPASLVAGGFSAAGLGTGVEANREMHELPPWPFEPPTFGAPLGAGTEAAGMEAIEDAGAPHSGSAGEGEVESDPRHGALQLTWIVYG